MVAPCPHDMYGQETSRTCYSGTLSTCLERCMFTLSDSTRENIISERSTTMNAHSYQVVHVLAMFDQTGHAAHPAYNVVQYLPF